MHVTCTVVFSVRLVCWAFFEISNIMRHDNLNLEYKRNSFYKERNLHINKLSVSRITHLHFQTHRLLRDTPYLFFAKNLLGRQIKLKKCQDQIYDLLCQKQFQLNFFSISFAGKMTKYMYNMHQGNQPFASTNLEIVIR